MSAVNAKPANPARDLLNKIACYGSQAIAAAEHDAAGQSTSAKRCEDRADALWDQVGAEVTALFADLTDARQRIAELLATIAERDATIAKPAPLLTWGWFDDVGDYRLGRMPASQNHDAHLVLGAQPIGSAVFDGDECWYARIGGDSTEHETAHGARSSLVKMAIGLGFQVEGVEIRDTPTAGGEVLDAS